MENCKPIETPGTEKLVLSKDQCPEENSEEQNQIKQYDYRGLIGALNYLSMSSRPDIAFQSHQLSRFLHNPGHEHWKAAKHVLRYLKHTVNYCLTYRKSNKLQLVAFSDADWAGDVDSRKSTSGFCVKLNNESACVAWSSKLQTTVATSTAEAEMCACFYASQELLYMYNLLTEMKLCQDKPITLFVDNQACIASSKNVSQSSKTKHVALKHSFLKDLHEQNLIKMSYRQTADMPADLLTKSLGKIKVQKFVKDLLGF